MVFSPRLEIANYKFDAVITFALFLIMLTGLQMVKVGGKIMDGGASLFARDRKRTKGKHHESMKEF